MVTCRECERLKLLLMLKRGSLLRTPVSETGTLNQLCEDIDTLEQELSHHMMSHFSAWEQWPAVIPVLDHGRLN